MSAIRDELESIERELLILQAKRDVLRKILQKEARDSREPASATLARPATASSTTPPSMPALRPTNPANTQAILDAVREHPGRTLSDIVEIVGNAMSADDAKKKQLYNTGYGLVRRDRIRKDDATGGLTLNMN